MTISNWKAERSGAPITITGFRVPNGEPVRVTGVTSIEGAHSTRDSVVAIDNKGVTYSLV